MESIFFICIGWAVIYMFIGFTLEISFLWKLGDVDSDLVKIVFWPLFTILFFIVEFVKVLKSIRF